MHKYIFVYQTFCLVNGKSYIGVHGTNEVNDGYIGAGINCQGGAKFRNSPFYYAVRKHGYRNFQRHILAFYDTYEEALEEERFIVNESWVKSKQNYNCALGGGGSPFYGMSDERKKEIWDNFKGINNHRYGKASLNRRKVIKYNFNNEIINIYDSITDAANSVNTNPTCITACCRGRRQQCKGYIFRYEDYTDKEKIELDENLINKARIYNTDGTFVITEPVKIKRLRNRKSTKGRICSNEAKLKMRIAKLGKKRTPHTEETKKKMALAQIGKRKIKNK